MNNMIKKVLSAAEEFVTSSNRLSLVADSILDRIVPKATAHAACREYRHVPGPCGQGSCGIYWITISDQYRDCAYCGSNLCGPWRQYGRHCLAC